MGVHVYAGPARRECGSALRQNRAGPGPLPEASTVRVAPGGKAANKQLADGPFSLHSLKRIGVTCRSKMAIYLDAEILFDISPKSLALSSLRVVAREHDLDIAIPQIALDEATAEFQRQMQNKAAAIRSAIAAAEGFFRTPDFTEPDVQGLAAQWRKARMEGFRVIPLTADHAFQAFAREIGRIPPGREGSGGEGRGARDSTIWLAARDDHMARSEPGYFISGNLKDFSDGKGQLKPELREEFGTHAPLEYVAEISDLVGKLAHRGGREFTTEELQDVRSLRLAVVDRLDNTFDLDLTTRLVHGAFRTTIPWSGIKSRYGEPALSKILQQTVYRIGSGMEVAVIRTRWVIVVEVELTGPLRYVQAGYTTGVTAVTSDVEVWARRNPETGEIEYTLTGPDRVEIMPGATTTLIKSDND